MLASKFPSALSRSQPSSSFQLYANNNMPGHSGFRYALILRKLVPSDHPPVFLAPLLASSPQPPHQRLQFSTATALSARYKKRRDGNPNRGVSALRRTGLKFPNAMSREPLPKPVLDPERRSKVQADPNHGLWGFFHKDRKALTTPEEDYAFGTFNVLYLQTSTRADVCLL